MGDLSSATKEQTLNQHFESNGFQGKIRSLKVVVDRENQKGKGYAYVNFYSKEEAETAIKTLQYSELNGRQIRLMRKDKSQLDNEKNIFVKNTGVMRSKDLFFKFQIFGDIVSAKVVVDENGKSKNYGFVMFKDKESVQESKKAQQDPNSEVEIIEYRDLKNNLYVKNLP